ncbi:unnamed protein product [Moneuplotes crassus]|uniref:RING-type E3 ubiquitin transferase n=1 Tax=Euplotes crassus TaxID=5936 RepID=A0AAD1XQQ5_EUPCR|nr:unnamed protein product [Moneuplotes crassus]
MGNRGTTGQDNDQSKQSDTPVIKNHNNIRKETIRLTKVEEDEGETYALNFTFSCSYDCVLTIYLCSTEYRSSDKSGPPVYFHTPDYVPEKPVSYKFSKGIRQKFPENEYIIDFSKFKEEDITSYKEDEYYPIVMTIETDYPPPVKDNLKTYHKNKRQAQITYGYFAKITNGKYQFRFNKQCFLFRNKLFKMEDIYGHEKQEEDGKNEFDESQKECVVCYSNIKDTIVYPCKHICLCSQCTQIVRMQNSKCPICRRQAEKFICIQIENATPDGNRNNSDENSAPI